MQIRKSANILVFIWKPYAEDFTLKHLSLFEITHVRYVKGLLKNIQKQWSMLKISLF